MLERVHSHRFRWGGARDSFCEFERDSSCEDKRNSSCEGRIGFQHWGFAWLTETVRELDV